MPANHLFWLESLRCRYVFTLIKCDHFPTDEMNHLISTFWWWWYYAVLSFTQWKLFNPIWLALLNIEAHAHPFSVNLDNINWKVSKCFSLVNNKVTASFMFWIPLIRNVLIIISVRSLYFVFKLSGGEYWVIWRVFEWKLVDFRLSQIPWRVHWCLTNPHAFG